MYECVLPRMLFFAVAPKPVKKVIQQRVRKLSSNCSALHRNSSLRVSDYFSSSMFKVSQPKRGQEKSIAVLEQAFQLKVRAKFSLS